MNVKSSLASWTAFYSVFWYLEIRNLCLHNFLHNQACNKCSLDIFHSPTYWRTWGSDYIIMSLCQLKTFFFDDINIQNSEGCFFVIKCKSFILFRRSAVLHNFTICPINQKCSHNQFNFHLNYRWRPWTCEMLLIEWNHSCILDEKNPFICDSIGHHRI